MPLKSSLSAKASMIIQGLTEKFLRKIKDEVTEVNENGRGVLGLLDATPNNAAQIGDSLCFLQVAMTCTLLVLASVSVR